MKCPSLPALHKIGDCGVPPTKQAEWDLHVLECSRCRDVLRQLRRLDSYLQRPLSANTNGLASAIPEKRTSMLRLAGGLSLAAVVVVAIMLANQPRVSTEPTTVPRAAEFGAQPSTLDASTLVALRSAPDAEAIAEVLRLGDPSSETAGATITRLQDYLSHHVSAIVDDLHRGIVVAAGLRCGLRTFIAPAQQLLQEGSLDPDAQRELLFDLARAGWTESLSTIQKLVDRPDIPTSDLVDALVMTRQRRAVSVLDQVLSRRGSRPEDRYPALARLPFPEAADRLVLAFLAGADGPAMRRALVERPDAIACLRASLLQQPADRRARVLGMLGEARCSEAVPELERMLVRGIDREGIEKTLQLLAQNGDREALFGLVRALPSAESESDLAPASSLVSVLTRWSDPSRGRALSSLRSAYETASRSLRRRMALAASLIGGAEGTHLAVLSLGDPREQRSAMFALRSAGKSEAGLKAALSRLNSGDRGVRRLALEIVAEHGGEAAMTHLPRALQRTEDRRVAVNLALRAEPGLEWAAAVLRAAERYRDVSELALSAQRARGRTPPRASPSR